MDENGPIKEFKEFKIKKVCLFIIFALILFFIVKIALKINENIKNEIIDFNTKQEPITENGYLLNYDKEEIIECDEKNGEYILKIGQRVQLSETGIIVDLKTKIVNNKNKYDLSLKYNKENNEYIFSEKDPIGDLYISNNYSLKIIDYIDEGIKFKILYTAQSFNNYSIISLNDSCVFNLFGKLKIELKSIEDKRENSIDNDAKINCTILIKYKEISEEYNLNLGENNKINVGPYILKLNGYDFNKIRVEIHNQND